jgi:hypothetical protein
MTYQVEFIFVVVDCEHLLDLLALFEILVTTAAINAVDNFDAIGARKAFDVRFFHDQFKDNVQVSQRFLCNNS